MGVSADTGRRLQTAVDRLLDIVYDASQRAEQRPLVAAEEGGQREDAEGARAELEGRLAEEQAQRETVTMQLNDARGKYPQPQWCKYP